MSLDVFLNAVNEDVFEEKPVPLEEFLYSEDFLGLPKLSHYQIKLIEALSQIYRHETMAEVWGEEEADRLAKADYREVIFQLGKGSGKDFTSSVAFARVIYLLLCLKEPARYFGKPKGDAIALLNVAVNAKQAQEVFFRGNLKKRIVNCPWFDGKYDKPTAAEIRFDKNITAYSGHSEREAWEGYNLLLVVLDEIAGFASEAETSGDHNQRGKTADAIYKMYRASVRSRFPKVGKIALLSFPRYKGDFIQQRYDAVIAEKTTEVRSKTFVIHEDLPAEGDNVFTISWDIDHIVSYKEPQVYALRRPTWDVNPTIDIDDFKSDFINDLTDSLSRFACMPPEAIDAFFKDTEKIQRAFPAHRPGPFNADWSFRESFQPEREKDYYVHVDLGYTQDRAAVALAHVSDWILVNYGGNWKHHQPQVVLDAVRYWTPRSDQSVDFSEIEEFILGLSRRGFNLKMVTFDRWNSVGFRQRLNKDYGIPSDLLSVAKPHYEDLKLTIDEERLLGYHLELAVDEMKGLRVIKGNKVDHPRKGSKDVSDAIAGAVYNAISNSVFDDNPNVEVRYLGAPKADNEVEQEETKFSPEMPREIADWIERMTLLGESSNDEEEELTGADSE